MPNRFRTAALVSAAGLLAAVAPAQLARGTVAPAFDYAKSWNDAPSFAELKGKLVMLDFFATW